MVIKINVEIASGIAIAMAIEMNIKGPIVWTIAMAIESSNQSTD